MAKLQNAGYHAHTYHPHTDRDTDTAATDRQIRDTMTGLGAGLVRVIWPQAPLGDGERVEIWACDGKTVMVQVYGVSQGADNGWALYLATPNRDVGAILKEYFADRDPVAIGYPLKRPDGTEHGVYKTLGDATMAQERMDRNEGPRHLVYTRWSNGVDTLVGTN